MSSCSFTNRSPRQQQQLPPSEDEISSQWPLHWLVWNNDHKALNRLLEQKVYNKEAEDPRGRTPLHLAVTLKHSQCAEVLLYHGANALALNRHQWSVLHEAICTGDSHLCGMVMALKDRQQMNARAKDIPLMLERLRSAPDFYIEMKWEFTSWIPFFSRMCPSDTYKIWKKGTQVRVDTSLVGFENLHWVRGKRSIVFEVKADGAMFTEIDHDSCKVWEQPFHIDDRHLNPVQQMMSHELNVVRKLRSPIVSTVFMSQNVSFERQKSGIWGFRSDKTETINGYKAKVFSASGLDIVTRTRVDHLPEDEKEKHKNAGVSPIQDFLGMAEEQEAEVAMPGGAAAGGSSLFGGGSAIAEGNDATAPKLALTEYFTSPSEPKKYDAIGGKAEVYSRLQGLKAIVWLSEDYPLSLQDQIMPIIELMSLNNAHFAKLKDFITLQMPAGYPVKFEIPLFHVMSARVTFGNVNGHNEPVPHVSLKTEEVFGSDDPYNTENASGHNIVSEVSGVKRRHTSSESDTGGGGERGHNPDIGSSVDPPKAPPNQKGCGLKEVCIISDEAFQRPSGYRVNSPSMGGGGGGGGGGLAEQEEEMLQLAIRQSLIEQGLPHGTSQDNEEISLVEALGDTAIMSGSNTTSNYSIPTVHFAPPTDDEIALAIALSQVQANEDARLQEQEEEELARVLMLSLQDK